MAAILHDEETLEESTEAEKPKEAPQEVEKEVEETPVEVSQVPDKYKDKTAEELVRMHQEAEKLLGRQSSEVGELRKTVDTFIQSNLSPEQEKETAKEVDFFEDPKAAVQNAIDNHPDVIAAKQATASQAAQQAVQDLRTKHPDIQDILVDQGFQDWIGKSKVRTNMLRKADQELDSELADELFSLWKERKQVVEQTVSTDKAQRKLDVSKASTGSASGTGATSKKIYRRADITALMQTDPDRYQAMSDEIMQAYREGRVK